MADQASETPGATPESTPVGDAEAAQLRGAVLVGTVPGLPTRVVKEAGRYAKLLGAPLVVVLTIPVADRVAVGAKGIPATAVRRTLMAGLKFQVVPVVFGPKSHTNTEGVVTPSPVILLFGPEQSRGRESQTAPNSSGANDAVVFWNVVCDGAVGSLMDIVTL